MIELDQEPSVRISKNRINRNAKFLGILIYSNLGNASRQKDEEFQDIVLKYVEDTYS